MRARLLAEAIGTGFLLVAVVGGNIAGTPITAGFAVGFTLAAFIIALGPISGAHFNPAVTVMLWLRGHLERAAVLPYIAAQVIGGIVGVVIAETMFDVSGEVGEVLASAPTGFGLAELVATFGLVFVIGALVEHGDVRLVGPAAGAFIAAMAFSASSGGFANPAVTFARMLTRTVGVEPATGAVFIGLQIIAAVMVAITLAVLSDNDS